ncbi:MULTISPECIES: hypothetical protein [Citricoccus]|uniref:Uncharacterized protein n=1 Tax=Citricoccus muralis TaxID=169134 RepID=A0ABY8H324_9MICC|nr:MULTISPECIES: hypothetical protein [Citricoccus]WBL18099.1 hypothetical protein O1A05_09855 [Citricoccus sp. NR2]WFP15519.1 hypothetical protein P8192_08845 [Citricoccus muralis]
MFGTSCSLEDDPEEAVDTEELDDEELLLEELDELDAEPESFTDWPG